MAAPVMDPAAIAAETAHVRSLAPDALRRRVALLGDRPELLLVPGRKDHEKRKAYQRAWAAAKRAKNPEPSRSPPANIGRHI
jgi:hypothetical protein